MILLTTPNASHQSHFLNYFVYGVSAVTMRILRPKANEMSIFFSNCNYSPNTIQSAINRISKISQAEALQPRPKQSTTKRTPLVLTYHPHMHRIKRIFLRNFKKILQHEKSDTKHIFTSPPLLAYRRDTNLKQLLVRSSLNPKPNGTHPCGHSLCRTCEHTNPSDAISGPNNTFHIQHHFTCSSVCVTPLLVPNVPLYILVKLAVSSIPDLENT